MKLKLLSAILSLSFLTSCSTSNIAVSEALKSNTALLEVKGNNGILINQKISFGNYRTSTIKKGWTNRTKLSLFGITHEKASKPIEFTQYGLNNASADVLGSNNFNSNMFDLFKGLQNYADNYVNGLFGVIIPKNSSPAWEVLVENDNSKTSLKSEVDHGIAVDENGNVIEIKGTKKLTESKFFTDDSKTFGFEMFRHGEAIAAVSVVGNGRVWIKNNLSDDDKLIVASIATLLITKKNLN